MANCCEETKKYRPDYLLWVSSFLIVIAYIIHFLFIEDYHHIQFFNTFTHTVFELINTMWFGILLGILFVGILSLIPREFVIAVLGKPGGVTGILRATGAGLFLDLCSHGILMVGMKLYERGASIGQVMAFLIASPWNSFSLTILLWVLVGFWWMMTFVLGSLIIAIISGLIFESLVVKKILSENPNAADLPSDFKFWAEAKKQWQESRFNFSSIKIMVIDGLKGSKMVLRWVFFGIILAALVRVIVVPELFQTLFGPTLVGLGLTLLVATVLEICSEGSLPVASDILTKANAPGNAFGFLMAGVATDYTEIMSLKDTTKSWKIALFLPLVTLPQVCILACVLNIGL